VPVIIGKAILAFFTTRSLLKRDRPEKIISTGGFLAIPVCLACWSKRIEIALFELNVVPGKAVKFLLPFVKTIFIVFEKTRLHCRLLGKDFSKKCVLTNYPVRFTRDDVTRDRDTVLTVVNKRLQENNAPLLFEKNRKTLFVVGGSQGSTLLNNLMTGFIDARPEVYSGLQIIHQIGKGDIRKWETWYAEKGIPSRVFGYDENIKDYYVLADLIVSRSGAGTMFEIVFFGKKCITIPLVAGTTDHQVFNARAMASMHPALFTVLEQDAVIKEPEFFYKKAIELLY
jgi:UDP-N-acetylglucosamine--N-acetylmuramyl-(pentapeptide) pyrophosphoryl-undecaprenol N-acetylglucosamine transferase